MTDPCKSPSQGPSQNQLLALHLEGLQQRPVPAPLLDLARRLQALLGEAERAG